MKNEMQIAATLPASTATAVQVTNEGDNVAQIVNQGVVNLNPTFYGNSGLLYNAGVTFNKEYYNLFAVDDDVLSSDYILVGKDRALTVSEGVAPEISSQYACLTPEAIDKIRTFPALFASKNHQQGWTDDAHLAYIGVVTDIVIQESNIKVSFQCFCSIPQQKLNELASELEIQSAPFRNEFDHAHWAIKKVDIVGKLRAVGFSIPIFP